MEGKGKYTGIWKNYAKIRLEYSDETLILRRNFFFQNALKIFLLALWSCSRYVEGVFNVFLCAGKRIMNVRYILQNIFKSWLPPLTPLRGGGQQLQRNFNSIWRDLCIRCFKITLKTPPPKFFLDFMLTKIPTVLSTVNKDFLIFFYLKTNPSR